jgi:hypothetical protein
MLPEGVDNLQTSECTSQLKGAGENDGQKLCIDSKYWCLN